MTTKCKPSTCVPPTALLLLIVALVLAGCTTTGQQQAESIPAPPAVTKPSTEQVSAAAGLCDDDSFQLVAQIKRRSQSLTGTPYSQTNGTDCSGMFHLLLEPLRTQCSKAAFPTMANARTTRGIAKWYHEYDNFQIIRNPANSGHLIKPGTVMFYGYSDGKYDRSSLTIDKLNKRGTGINHVAVVVGVEEKDGIVVSYQIFHGRRPGKPAGETTSWRKHGDLPTYGNWKEPWLGIATHILTPKLAVQ